MRRLDRKEQDLVKYIRVVRQATNQREWVKQFLGLLQSLEDPGVKSLNIENKVQASWEYTVIGTLVFDFRKNVHSKWGGSEDRLMRQIEVLKYKAPKSNFGAVTTNGLAFHIYNPLFDSEGRVVELEVVGGFNLANPRMTPAKALEDLVSMLTCTGP